MMPLFLILLETNMYLCSECMLILVTCTWVSLMIYVNFIWKYHVYTIKLRVWIKNLDQIELLVFLCFFSSNNSIPTRMDYTTSLREYTVNTSDYTTQPLKLSSHADHRCALVTELTSKPCGSSVVPNASLCCLLTITGSRWERKSSSHRVRSLSLSPSSALSALYFH